MTGGDLLREAVAELYSADPDEFIARRGELAAGARSAGEAAVAKRIGTLRKPTRSAWVVNRLVRAEPGAVTRLAALGAELRAAQQSLNGPALRELSRQRGQLVGELARQAFKESGLKSPPAALRDEVASTLGAALADPQVAEQLRAGALERAVQRDGLQIAAEWPSSEAPPAPLPRREAPPEAVAQGGSRRRGQARGGGKAERGEAPDATPTVVPLPSARRRAPATEGTAAGARPAANVTALPTARAKAERAKAERAKADRAKADRAKADRARHRQAIEAGERAVTEAEQAERAAARVEEDQLRAVQGLEEELADARQRLAEARIRAQRARTGHRQARRALDRLQNRPQA